MRILLIAGAALFVAMSSPVSAQDSRDEEARANFEAGRAAMSDGRYEDAYEYFARAHELSARPELLFNMGSVAERLRRDEMAIEHYEAYLAEVPDAANAPEVRSRIEIMREAMASPVADPGEPAEDVEEGTPLVKQWWLWAIVGAVVVGGVTAGVVLGTQGGGGVQDPLPGTGGVVVEALSVSF